MALPPGSKIRFRVSSPDGRRGSSWSISTAKHAPDTYLTHREGGTWIHVSMHRDGRRHHAVTKAGRERLPTVPAYLAVTHAHGKVAEGWRHEVRITVAVAELREGWIESEAKARDVVEVPSHPEFDAVSIDVFLAAPNAPRLAVKDACLVADMDRAQSGRVMVIARPSMLDVPLRSAFATPLAEAVAGIRQQGWDGHRPTRVVIFGEDPDGFSREIEFAVDPD